MAARRKAPAPATPPATAGLSIEYRALATLAPYERNARTHSAAQVAQIAASIKEFGFTNPLLIGEAGDLIAGHGRLAAAHLLEMATVPVIVLRGLSDAQRKALRIADNRLPLSAGWDEALLAAEIEDLKLEEYNLDVMGFDAAELEHVLNGWAPNMDAINKTPAENAAMLATIKVKCFQSVAGIVSEAVKAAVDALSLDGVTVE